MQVSQDISSNSFGAEDLINFRPSPNFKNMKKFFKKEFVKTYEENELKNVNVVTAEPLPPPVKSEHKKEVQPPLPFDPPPNDKIDDNNIQKTSTSVDHGHFREKPVETDPNKAKVKPKETICRDFLRGTCTRIGCRFAHKSDVSPEDLYGVHTFCREYQSQVCTRAHCRYVHATVFEEQEYYRTRYLPPHAFAHRLNNNNNTNKLLMPPPPPPPPKTQEPPASNKETVNFNVPPPPLHNDGAISGAANCVTSNAMTAIPSTIASMTSMTPLVQTSPKRDWTLMESFSNSGRIEVEVQASKKCKLCNHNEFRYQYNKDKLEKIKQAKEDIHKKIAILDKNSEKLNTFIQALLIRSLSKSPNLHSLKDKYLSEMVGALATMQKEGQV